jgi:gliding motility-associated-like protein
MEKFSLAKYKLPGYPLTIFVVFILSIFFYQRAKAQCINAYPHVEDFETGPVWTSFQFYGANDWAWGTPAHPVINTAGSGTKSWCLGGLTGSFYQFNEQSWVQSPCYDFTNLQYPHIALKIFYETEWKYDGTKLQYSLDNGTTWITIGAYGDANDCNTENWYNTNSTSSYSSGTITGGGAKPVWFPASDATAKDSWAGNTHPVDVADDPSHAGVTCYHGNGSTKWIVAQHCLTGLAGKPNVIFRLAFSCGYACNGYDGFAFDSVAVSNGIPNTTGFNSTCGAGNTLNFTVPAKACPTTTWAWNFGDALSGASNTSTTENPSHAFSAPGAYTVTLIASGGACNPPDTATKVVHIMNASITSFSNATCNILGSATALATGGTAPTYSWSNGTNTASTSSLTAGTYTVTMTDPAACPTMTTVTITQPTPIVITLSSNPATCNTNNGTATATSVTGGTSPYSYSWNGPAGAVGTNTTTVSGLAIGNYTLLVTDANACTATQTVTVTNSSGLNVTVASGSVTCNGGANGSITVTATGGTAPLSYSWSPIGGGTKTTTLPAGTYTIAVSDASPCTVTNIVTIIQPTALTATATSTPATCGQSNGTASVSVSGGTTPYNTTYTWSPSGGSGATATNLAGNTYSVTIKDANGCTVTTQTTVAQQSSINLSVSNTPAKCGINNGTAIAVATGGTGTITYTWAPAGGNTSTATALAPGMYTLSVSDASGCITNTTTTVGNHPSPVVSTTKNNVFCFGASTGSASVSIQVATGTAPFSYSWSPSGGTNALASNLSAGTTTTGVTYSVVVTDAVGCKDSSTAIITQPPALTVTATNTTTTCGLANGSAACNVSGGTPNYTYTWSPTGGNLATATNLSGNTYTITVTDANSCQVTAQTTVAQTASLSLSVSSTPAKCGLNNGTATALAAGGNGAFTYTWAASGGNSGMATALAPGLYTISVSDAMGCSKSATTIVGNFPSPVLSTSSANVLCFGASTGSASVSINAGTGTAPFSYSWSPSGGTNAFASNLSAGTTTTGLTYSIVVTDAEGCKDSSIATITQPPPLTVTATSTQGICGKANGSTTCTATGGTPAYGYTWTPTGGNALTTTNLMGPQSFTVSVQDANKCIQTASVLVKETPALILSVSTTTNVTCYGGVDGLIAASASGGTGIPTYTWLPSGGNLSTASSLTATVTGTTYTVMATDSLGCFAMNSATIKEPPPITITVNDQTICDGFSATLTATVSGGNGSAPSYTWNPGGENTSAITVNPTSTTPYVVSVENTGCTQIAQATATVNVYPAVTITVTPSDSICNGQQTTLSASASGGDGTTFNYVWSTNQSAQSIVVSPGSTTVYSVIAQDAACPPVNASTQVAIYKNPIINLSANITNGCGTVCVSFTASATNVPGNTISSNYHWYFGDGGPYVSGGNLENHCYYQTGSYNVMLTATTQHNCFDTLVKQHFINVHTKPTADFDASTYETNIDNATVHFYNQSTGIDIINLNWSIDTITASIPNPFYTFHDIGTYPVTLIVTDSMGCKDTVIKDIIIVPDYTFYAPNCLTPNGDGKNESFIPVGMGWDDSTYNLWIYDRWGIQVMHTTDPNTGWNGTRHDGVVQQDTYVWEVSLSDVFGKPHSYHGIVSVVR